MQSRPRHVERLPESSPGRGPACSKSRLHFEECRTFRVRHIRGQNPGMEDPDHHPASRMHRNGPHEEASVLVRSAELARELVPYLFRRFLVQTPIVDQSPEDRSHLPVLDHHSMLPSATGIIALEPMLEPERDLAWRLPARRPVFPWPRLSQLLLEARLPVRIILRNLRIADLPGLDNAQWRPVGLLPIGRLLHGADLPCKRAPPGFPSCPGQARRGAELRRCPDGSSPFGSHALGASSP